MDEHKEENKSYQSVINTLIISASILIAAFFLFKLTESISSMEASLNNLNSSSKFFVFKFLNDPINFSKITPSTVV